MFMFYFFPSAARLEGVSPASQTPFFVQPSGQRVCYHTHTRPTFFSRLAGINKMRVCDKLIPFISVFSLSMTLVIPALLLQTPIPIDVFTGPVLSIHVLAAAGCGSGLATGCVGFVASQYALDYAILFSPITSAVRGNYAITVVSWCVVMITTPLTLLLSFTIIRRRIMNRCFPPPSQSESPVVAPTGIPVMSGEQAEGFYIPADQL